MTTHPARTARGLLLALALLALIPATALAGSAGEVNFAKPAESAFDAFTSAPSATQQTWMRDKYSRMRTYAPYFDSRLSWFPSAWSYEDAYAIYPGKETGLEQHILTDSGGRRLYIPYACSGGTCTQYAADIGDPGWRRHYIGIAKDRAAKGYPTPASRSWTVTAPPPADATPPDTKLTGGPAGSVTTQTATFGLVSTEPGGSFQCRLDGAAWTSCTDPVRLIGLALGAHAFEARARGPAGNVDLTPARSSWRILSSTKQKVGETAGRPSVGSSSSGTQVSSPSAPLSRVLVRGRAVRGVGTGRIRPSRVRVVLERRKSGRWGRVASRSVRLTAGGRFQTTFGRMPTASYRVRLRPAGRARLRLVAERGMPRLLRA